MSDQEGTTLRGVLVLDFGAQYGELIARRVRELGFYSEVLPYSTPLPKILARQPLALILSGGPHSTVAHDAPAADKDLFALGLPVLGICYGMQAMARAMGGQVANDGGREYGRTMLRHRGNALFAGLPTELSVWMSHADQVSAVPDGFETVAFSAECPHAAMVHRNLPLAAVQFHPEVSHTTGGRAMLNNFLTGIAKLLPNWQMADVATQKIDEIKQQVGDGQAICALSGGIDSTVAAVLTQRAIGDRLHAVFVDHGLLRAGELDEVRQLFAQDFPLDLQVVDARDLFLQRLHGVSQPEEKRRIIGETFIRTFEERAVQWPGARFLVQGTLYPDVIESGGTLAAKIKSHHNVGGLPAEHRFSLVEPLRNLFKDEVRAIGTTLGLAPSFIRRQPFPGPGLAIRMTGPVTAERLSLLAAADRVVRDTLADFAQENGLWQWFAVLPGVRSVGVMGDGRSYEEAVVVRAVTSEDGMTADWAKLPHDLLDRLAQRLVAEVPGINRVLYDITSKPPGTIEWE